MEVSCLDKMNRFTEPNKVKRESEETKPIMKTWVQSLTLEVSFVMGV